MVRFEKIIIFFVRCIMRFVILFAVGLLFCAIPVNAGYDYVIEDGYASRTLKDYETLLMTGGGGHHFTFFDYSIGVIRGTDPLIDDITGGIWILSQAGYSRMEFSGGEVHQFDIGSYAEATFSGGRIDEIRSYQSAYTHAGWPDPHITIVSDLDSVNHNIETNVLTGNWLDGTGFNIHLVDVDGYSPAIENIQFIPEPASLLLVVAGMAFMRKRASRIV